MSISNIYPSFICVVIGIILIFAHSMTADPTDPDLQISNSLFIRIIALLFISSFGMLCYLNYSSGSSKNLISTGQNILDDKW